MREDEFVYAVIPDHADSAEDFGRLLEKQDGQTYLDRAIHRVFETKFETGVDVIIVLSSNEAVLDAAGDMGAVSQMVPGFFDTDSMIRTFAADPGVDIDPMESPWIVVVDPYSLEFSEHRKLNEIRS